ncbi:general substrate transporter [Radiomyces spectabilis]|uniref:general substrate transporter n=1 Tax=Radiomyces spectabilis TaxID=64574 RepID=UPI00221EC5BE|nr:general substrate transporter [Radiomyces spectabilis]KAI8379330.1 general substrate transporter [Radiomyces spectabilis]
MDSRHAGLRPFVVFCVVIASLGAMNNGFNTSSLNIPASAIRKCPGVPEGQVTYYPNSPLPQCLPMGDWIWGVATGMFAIGGLLGAMMCGPMSQKFGRRDSMIIINISFFIGAILLSTSVHSAQFAIGRIFVGIGAGFMTVVISMYIAETSPPKYRGALGSFLQLFVTLGILIIEAIGLGLTSAVGWRIVVVITVVPAIIQMICLPFCARSPRWLINHNRIDEARLELLRLRKGDVEEEFADILLNLSKGGGSKTAREKQQQQGEQAHPSNDSQSEVSLTFWQVMSIRVLAILTLKMMVVHMAGQLTGINAVMYYSTSIFENSFGDDAKYVTVGVAGLNVFITLIGLALIDNLGRKKLLLISSTGMCIFATLITIGLRFNVGPLQVVCVMLFVASYAVGLGMVPFIITAEVYPTYAVGAASSAALMVNWLCNFIIGLVFPALQSACGPYVFLIFTGITFFVTIFIIFFVPETKQKSIEDLGRELGWAGLDTQAILAKANKNDHHK